MIDLDKKTKPLDVERAYSVLKLKPSPDNGATLSEQVAPYTALPGRLILDADGVEFNSMRIGELVNVYNQARERSGSNEPRIALIRLSRTSREVFERVHLNRLFALCDTVEEALASLADRIGGLGGNGKIP